MSESVPLKADRLLKEGRVHAIGHDHGVFTTYEVHGDSTLTFTRDGRVVSTGPHTVTIGYFGDGIEVMCTCPWGTERDPAGPACSHKLAAACMEGVHMVDDRKALLEWTAAHV